MSARARTVWLLTAALGLGCDDPSTPRNCPSEDCSHVCVFGDCLGSTPVPDGEYGGSGGTNGGGTNGGGSSARGTGATNGGSSASGGQSSAGMSSGGVPAGGATGVACAPGSAGEQDVGLTPVCLGLHANALVADPVRGKLYAVIGEEDVAHPNELVVIDAERAAIEASVAIGSNPDALAISDDATRLWVGLQGSLSVREVDLTVSPPAPGNEYPVPPLSFEDQGVYALRLAVLPGSTESIALSLRCTDGCAVEVAVMDAGTPRPARVSELSKLTPGPNGYVFGYNDRNTRYDFATLAVDEASGPTATVLLGLIDGFDTDITYDAGYVFASSGQVVDVSTPESPFRAGAFAYKGNVVPHVQQQRVVMLSYSSPEDPRTTRNGTNTLALRDLDFSTYGELYETPLAGKYTIVRDFVEVKPRLFAFIDSQDIPLGPSGRPTRLYLFRATDFTQ